MSANVAARPDWLHDEVVTLMRHVGQMTASHIRVLELLRDPGVRAERQAVTYSRDTAGWSLLPTGRNR
jgi:hypothetical protein